MDIKKGCLITLIVILLEFSFAQNPIFPIGTNIADFGTLIEHFIDDNDSLSSPKIFEFVGDDGLTQWFSRDVVKVVCLDTVCRLARLRLFWNIKGDYLRFEVPKGEPLTKLDHIPFTKSDYDRLDQILKDSLSILKNIEEKDLVIKKADDKTTNDKVDGYTGATTPSVREYAIKGAVYTCYTLWHTVYGTTTKKIRQIEGAKVSSDYISRLFGHEDNLYSSHAISLVKMYPEYDSIFLKTIIGQIKSTNDLISNQALNFFTKEQLAVPDIQKQLGQIFMEISFQRKFELLNRLSDVPTINSDFLIYLLQLFEEKQISATSLSYVYKLIRIDNLKNPLILERLKGFSKHENLYVRNITEKVLSADHKF